MRGFGEIARLAPSPPPAVGVVTSVGAAHTAAARWDRGGARAKAELVEALEPHRSGRAQRRRPRVRAMADRTIARRAARRRVARRRRARRAVRLDDRPGRPSASSTPWGATEVELAVSGRHMALDAAARHRRRRTCGVPWTSPPRRSPRTRCRRAGCGCTTLASGAIVVDDAYNANPISMRAGLDALAAMTPAGASPCSA